MGDVGEYAGEVAPNPPAPWKGEVGEYPGEVTANGDVGENPAGDEGEYPGDIPPCIGVVPYPLYANPFPSSLFEVCKGENAAAPNIPPAPPAPIGEKLS